VRTKFAQALVVCALVFAIGAHWVILQSVAWVGMAVAYSQNSSLKQALVKTFDGKHPCTLCKVVQHGKNTDKRAGTENQVPKLDLLLDLNATDAMVNSPSRVPISALATIRLRSQAPPSPPPKTVLS